MVDSGNSTPLELGTRFTPDAGGWIQAVRFYKGPGNTGAHVGHLWSSTGTLLATVNFANETAGGWQSATLSQPVPVTAGSTYTVSYWAPVGHYAATSGFFTAASWVNAPLTAPAGGNGVFTTVSGGAPSDSFGNTNYWVDAVFTTAAPPDTTAPTVAGTDPADGATSVPQTRAVAATFSEPVQAGSAVVALKTTSGGVTVAGTTSYDSATNTVSFTPSAALADVTGYTATVSAASDIAGNTLASPKVWTFTTATAASGSCPCSLWPDATVPAVPATSDAAAVELGVTFRTAVAGTVTGARFYKGAGNSGTHDATLWSATGAQLATATFTGESAAGWQQVSFGQPVAVTANTTYVISYHAPVGRYAADVNYFATAGTDRGVLHGLQSGVDGPNGVYVYGARAFPTLGGSANYWVDVVFASGAAPPDTTPPSVATWSPATGATGVSPSSGVGGVQRGRQPGDGDR
ncbi:MAG TPA: DUF4082 domain-containing protein [Kineosporiaceae bacterium]|nr:DUF4082 domain-containing protein [Kineosporiaceae bacterium]